MEVLKDYVRDKQYQGNVKSVYRNFIIKKVVMLELFSN